MWDNYTVFIFIGLAIAGVLLSYRVWGDSVYIITKNWRVVAFVLICGMVGGLAAVKQEGFKYELAYYYYTGTKNVDKLEARYQIRQCKNFVQAKLNGEVVENNRSLTAGIFKVGSISNWEFCARTFGLNYWKHDISIDGQDGGRLLCDAYARDTYRSGKVQNWCDTVFAPGSEPTDQKI